MYKTPSGQRILLNAERRLYSFALASIVDHSRVNEVHLNVDLHDKLQPGAKLVALYQSARALLCPDEPAPARAAYLDAAIAGVFRYARDMVESEVLEPEHGELAYYWRKLVHSVAEQLSLDTIPSIDCRNMSDWDFVFECLSDNILIDRDFETEALLDADPANSSEIKEQLGIDPDYFTAVPIDPPDNQINLYLDALIGLTPTGRGFSLDDDDDFDYELGDDRDSEEYPPIEGDTPF